MELPRKIMRFSLIVLLIATALAVPEIVARIFIPSWAPPVSDAPSHFIPNPYTGWLHPPSSPVDNRGEQVFSNHLGLRDSEWGEKTKPRILFLGDSFTWGWGVSNRERYTDRLQSKLPNIQVINTGITGFGTLQEFFLLKHFIDEIKPDYVVLQMYTNDFLDNLTPDGAYPHPYIDHLNHYALTSYPAELTQQSRPLRMVVYIGEHTYFYRQLIVRIYLLWLKLNIVPDDEPPRPEPNNEDMAVGMKLSLKMLYDFCAEKNLPVIVFTYEMDKQQQKVIADISAQQHVAAIPLEPALKGATQDTNLGDRHAHWNAYGNELIAQYMYPHIVAMISKK